MWFAYEKFWCVLRGCTDLEQVWVKWILLSQTYLKNGRNSSVCMCVQLCMLNTYVSWRVMHWWLVLMYAYLCVNWMQIGRKSWHRWVEASTTLVTLYHRTNWKSSWKHTMWVVILLNRVVSHALWKDFGMHFYCCEFFSIYVHYSVLVARNGYIRNVVV